MLPQRNWDRDHTCKSIRDLDVECCLQPVTDYLLFSRTLRRAFRSSPKHFQESLPNGIQTVNAELMALLIVTYFAPHLRPVGKPGYIRRTEKAIRLSMQLVFGEALVERAEVQQIVDWLVMVQGRAARKREAQQISPQPHRRQLCLTEAIHCSSRNVAPAMGE